MKIIIVIFLMSFLFFGCGKTSHKVDIAEIRMIERLRVLQVQVAETLTLETEKSKQVYLVVGYGDYEIDFNKIKKEHSEDGIVLKMPSIVIDPSVDSTKMRTYDRYTAIGYKDNKIHKMREIVDREARKLVKKAATQEEYMKIAKKQTENILQEMLPDKKVTLKWDNEEAVESYNYGGYEIRKTQHGAFEVSRQGVSVGYSSMSKADCEKWIKKNN